MSVPEPWTTELTTSLVSVPGLGPSVIGRQRRRSCGCVTSTGIRLDKQEPIFGANPCGEHGPQCEGVLAALRALPPSDEPIEDLFERLLEASIGGADE